MKAVNLSQETAAVIDQSQLRLSGQMQTEAVTQVFEQILKGLDTTITQVDLSQVSAMDSSCLAMLLYLQSRQSAPLTLVGLPEQGRDLVALYDLAEILGLVEQN